MEMMNQIRANKVKEVISKMHFEGMKIQKFNKNTDVVSVPVSELNVHSFLSFLSE